MILSFLFEILCVHMFRWTASPFGEAYSMLNIESWMAKGRYLELIATAVCQMPTVCRSIRQVT